MTTLNPQFESIRAAGLQRLRTASHRASGSFDLVEVLEMMTSPQGIQRGALPDEIQDATSYFGRGGPGHCVTIPGVRLLRDLTSASITAGAPVLFPVGSLSGLSVVAEAGVKVMYSDVRESPKVPDIASPPTASFVVTEGDDAALSEPVFGTTDLNMRTVSVRVSMSRRLLKQGGEVARKLVISELEKAIWRGIDTAFMAGTGASGQPTGLNSLAGVGTQAGASLSWSGAQAMIRSVADAGARDENIRFIGTPTVRETLAKRERAAGSGFIWDAGQIGGVKASVSNQCPSGTLFCGDFSESVCVIHGGITLIVDPRFTAALNQRLTILTDVGFHFNHPAAYCKATSVT